MKKLFLNALLLICTSVLQGTTRDSVSNQLINYNSTYTGASTIQTRYGVNVDDITNILTAGEKGPVLLQDVVFLDTMSHFVRERIPERVVHAKGAGAFGVFEVTEDISTYSKACVFEKGKKTRIAVRFSVVAIESGGADTARDPRGFAIKFYTDCGIWDLVGNNTPIFFIRDPMMFPNFIHSQKRNPVTHVKDPDMFWDFVTLRQETTYQMMITFSEAGTPYGYRYMNGFGSHTFKLVNAEGNAVYAKFHYLSNQGIKNFTSEEATEMAGKDPDFSTRDLYNAISNKNYPTWTFYIQVMNFSRAASLSWDPFDLTKVWPEDEFPLRKVGVLKLNENPKNYFEDVEQIAFSPAHMIPGIEPSPDKMLQGRLFAYSDSQRYRLGVNHLQLPVNCPYRQVTNYQRDGAHTIYNQRGAPNYYPNSFGGPINDPTAALSKFSVTGDVMRHDTQDEDNFSQATDYYNSLSEKDRRSMIRNIAEHLKNAAPFLQTRAINMFSKVNASFGMRIKNKMQNSP